MVFHTAPPHPASKARIICSPQLVGGAEASQKGFGELMPPAKSRTLISGIGGLRPFEHLHCATFAIRHGINHFASSVDAIPSRKVTRVARLARDGISDNATMRPSRTSTLRYCCTS